MAKRIAVLVSGGGTNLQSLIDAQARGEIVNGEIAAVIASNPDAYALERAKKAGIPTYVVARKSYPSSQAMTVALWSSSRRCISTWWCWPVSWSSSPARWYRPSPMPF